MAEVLHFENVSWRRNNQEILKDISWQVKQGEQWCILGLNGSGKTSLLNIVNGYNYPTSGQVSVLGNEFGKTNIPNLRKKIGFVSSSLDRFAPKMERELIEDIVVSGKFASIGIYEEVSVEDWEQADTLLASLGLSYLKGKYFHNLSQGEQQKVLICRALMSKPEILILDEPCTGLDVLAREEVLQWINKVNERNFHLLYVTHHIEEIVDGITHVLLIRDGRIIASGRKHEVLTDQLLTQTYKIPVTVRWENQRPWLTIQKVKSY